jgi:hypothetical protein
VAAGAGMVGDNIIGGEWWLVLCSTARMRREREAEAQRSRSTRSLGLRDPSRGQGFMGQGNSFPSLVVAVANLSFTAIGSTVEYHRSSLGEQVVQESLAVRLATQEVNEALHLVPAIHDEKKSVVR